ALVVAATTTPDVRRIAEETMPELPAQVGGGSSKTITRGIRWASFSFSTTPRLEANLIVQATDADTAKKLNGLAESFVKNVVKELQNRSDERAILGALGNLVNPKVQNDRVVVQLDEAKLTQELPKLSNRVHAATARVQSMNNLKQMVLAAHN